MKTYPRSALMLDGAAIIASPHSDDYLVDSSGYIPKEQQLQLLMQSGAALDRYNRKRFPGFQDELHDEQVVNIMAQKSTEVFDVLDQKKVLQSNFNHRIEELKKLRKEQSNVQTQTQTQDVQASPPVDNPAAANHT